MFGFIKRLFTRVDNFREDLEDIFAKVLDKIDENTQIDELEVILIKKGIKLAVSRYGIDIPDKAYETIGKTVVKSISKTNRLLAEQLRKR